MSTAEVIEVTPEQFEAIEAAWFLCSWRNPRQAKELWATAFRGCVAEVIGREPPDEFKLRVAASQGTLMHATGAEGLVMADGSPLLDYLNVPDDPPGTDEWTKGYHEARRRLYRILAPQIALGVKGPTE